MQVSESVTFTPSARLDYARVRTDGYMENGSIANLNVDSNTAEELIVGLDGKLRYAVNTDTAIMANAGVGYDTINDQTSINSIFRVDPTLSFNTQGIDRSPWLGRGGVGIASRITGGGELSARYDVEGRENRYDHLGSFRIKWNF